MTLGSAKRVGVIFAFAIPAVLMLIVGMKRPDSVWIRSRMLQAKISGVPISWVDTLRMLLLPGSR